MLVAIVEGTALILWYVVQHAMRETRKRVACSLRVTMASRPNSFGSVMLKLAVALIED